MRPELESTLDGLTTVPRGYIGWIAVLDEHRRVAGHHIVGVDGGDLEVAHLVDAGVVGGGRLSVIGVCHPTSVPSG